MSAPPIPGRFVAPSNDLPRAGGPASAGTSAAFARADHVHPADGLLIASAHVDDAGHLIVGFSDGSSQDAGFVKGGPGGPGAPGLSIASAALDASGHLILTFSDASTHDAGAAKGAPGTPGSPGVSVASATVDASGHLILTFSDTSTHDAGAVKGTDAAGLTVSTQGASYTAALADANSLIRMNAAAAVTLTIPDDTAVAWSTLASAPQITVTQAGAGKVSIAAGGAVSLLLPSDVPASTRRQHSTITAIRVAANTWLLAGDFG